MVVSTDDLAKILLRLYILQNIVEMEMTYDIYFIIAMYQLPLFCLSSSLALVASIA